VKKTNPSITRQLRSAELLHIYMKARAKSEGKGYSLTPAFFASALKQGCAKFFGVTLRGASIACDEQNPAFLELWRAGVGRAQ
jgi:hypothetical protein